MPYQIEVTDTFGGDANYCWVKRGTINAPDNATRRYLVRKAKAFAGWTNWKCEVRDLGDIIEIRPWDANMVCFVSWQEGRDQ